MYMGKQKFCKMTRENQIIVPLKLALFSVKSENWSGYLMPLIDESFYHTSVEVL